MEVKKMEKAERNKFGELIVSCQTCDKIRMDIWGNTFDKKGCGSIIKYWCTSKEVYLENNPAFTEPCESHNERIGKMKPKRAEQKE